MVSEEQSDEKSYSCYSERNLNGCHSERSEESHSVKPLDIMEALEKENVESRPIWKPMHMQPFFKEYDFVGEGVGEKIFKNGVCLPSDTKMTDDNLYRVCDVIKALWANEEVYKEKVSTSEVL